MLPEIKITYRANAKSLRLRVYPHQICLTAPKGATQKKLQDFISAHQVWLEQTWQAQHQSLPSQIQLFNLDFPLQVCLTAQRNRYILDLEKQVLFIRNIDASKHLKQFILDYAKKYLPIVLDEISGQTQIPFRHVQVRYAQSRWGSCSTSGKIMLNAMLVFASMPLVRYVCIHELVHIRHFNHSRCFWDMVQTFDSEYVSHRKQLKTLQIMPIWQS